MGVLRRLSVVLLLALAALRGQGQEAWPDKLPQRLSQPVNDLAGMLSEAGSARLDQGLRQAYANGQGPQVVLVTLPSIGDRAIEDVGIQVARGWGIGDKERKDGVLLLLAAREHRVRIEVGTKFEGVLTDIACQRIISDSMKPLLRNGDADGAIEAGIGSDLLAVVAPGAGQGLADSAPAPSDQAPFPFGLLILIAIVVVLNILRRLSGFGGRGGWGGGYGGGFGGGGFSGGGGGSFGGGGGGFSGGGSSGGW